MDSCFGGGDSVSKYDVERHGNAIGLSIMKVMATAAPMVMVSVRGR